MIFNESTSRAAHIWLFRMLRILLPAVFLMFFGISAYPQGNTGRILGTVTDLSGAIIAGATVTVTDVQRGIARTLTADEGGQYAAPNLLPGTYSVKAEARGFRNIEHSWILLQVGNDLRVDLTLQPGEAAQTIIVTAETPLVESNNATLGGTLSNETINDLPLNGRNYQNLLTLRPGMTFYAGGGGWTQSTNGIRVEDNQYIVDGLTNDNPFTGLTIINGPGIAGDAATILPIDGIQELTVQENPRAEFLAEASRARSSMSACGPGRIPFTARPTRLAATARGTPATTSTWSASRSDLSHCNSTEQLWVGPSNGINSSTSSGSRLRITRSEILLWHQSRRRYPRPRLMQNTASQMQ